MFGEEKGRDKKEINHRGYVREAIIKEPAD
jgi:hypothetical protein